MTVTPISKEKHLEMGWAPPTNLKFARSISAVPITVTEFPYIATEMPIILVKIEEKFHFAALMSIENGTNLWVTEEGKWRGNYIPAHIRGYPFSLELTSNDKAVLCIDEGICPIINASDGKAFFTTDGNLSDELAKTLEFLEKKEFERRQIGSMAQALAEFGIIQPAKITFNLTAGKRSLEGYHQISEKLLHELSDRAFLDLRKTGVLPLIYLHLQSLVHWKKFIQLHEGETSAATAMKTLGDEIFNFSPEETIKFDDL